MSEALGPLRKSVASALRALADRGGLGLDSPVFHQTHHDYINMNNDNRCSHVQQIHSHSYVNVDGNGISSHSTISNVE